MNVKSERKRERERADGESEYINLIQLGEGEARGREGGRRTAEGKEIRRDEVGNKSRVRKPNKNK